MATLRKMSGNEMDNALRDKVGNIMNNIAFTTGEKVHLEWQHSTALTAGFIIAADVF